MPAAELRGALGKGLDAVRVAQVRRDEVGLATGGPDLGNLREDADPDRLALAVLAAVQGGLLLTQTPRIP